MIKHYENHDIENNLYQEGYKYIAGTDEAGRGPLAGPVVVAAVIMPKDCYIEGVTDSKKVPEKLRYELADKIKKEAISYKIVFIDNETIDKMNILEASRYGMIESLLGLTIKPDYILTDAMELPTDIPYQALIKGDALSFSIACASILAKTARDSYMIDIDKKYPEYDFKTHKGYPTKSHLEAIQKYGILPIHRLSYKPVYKEFIKNNFNNRDVK